MATSNQKDVRMTLSVETLGEADIKQLQAAVQALANQGGDAAPEFQKLADEIGRLGEQSQSLQVFRSIANDIEQLGLAQAAAATRTQELATALAAQRTVLESSAVAQQAAAKALDTNAIAARENVNDLRVLASTYREGSLTAEQFGTQQRALLETQRRLSTEAVGLARDQREANAAVREAEAGYKTLDTQQRNATNALRQVANELDAQQRALEAAAAAAEAMGLSTADVAAAEATLLLALRSVSDAANQRMAANREMAESNRLLEIQERSMATLYAASRAELLAMQEAQLQAAAGARAYAAAKDAALAEGTRWATEAFAIVETAEAAQRLARETEILAAAARELNAQRAFEQQAEDAQRLIQAAAYVREVTQALEQQERQAEATRAAAQRIAGAFENLGIRSVEELDRAIVQTRRDMTLVAAEAQRTGNSFAGAFAAGEARIKSLQREIREVNGELTLGDKAAKLFENSLGQIAAGNVIADGIGFLVQKVKDLGVAFVTTVVETEKLRRALDAIYKNSATAASQFQVLRTVAQEAGISIGGIQAAFVRFSAATKSSNIPLEITNELFASVAKTAGTLGLSADATAGTLDALGQIASKSVVSLEELRQQLGDRMPGALSAAAKGLGLTEAQLIKLVESGQLAARDFFPAFSKGLKEMQGETNGLANVWARFTNALTIAAQNAGDAGWLEIFSTALRALALAVAAVLIPLNAMFELMGAVARTGGALAAAVLQWSNPWENLVEIWSGARTRQEALVESFRKVILAGDQAAATAQTLATTTTATTAAVAKAGEQWDAMSRSQQANAIAAEIVSARTGDLSAQLVGITAVTQELLKAQEKETEALTKQAKAAKENGDTMLAVAKMRGNEAETLLVSAQAAEMHAAALDLAAKSQAEEVRLLDLQRDALIKTRDEQKQSAEATKQQTQELEKKIVIGKAEIEQTNAAADAARREAAARRVTLQTYGDQSKEVVALRAEYERLTKQVQDYDDWAKRGVITDKDAKKAREDLAAATVRYKDAVADATRVQALELEGKRNLLVINQASLQGEVDLAQAKADSYRQQGQLTLALMAERDAKLKKIEVDRLSIQIKEVELQLLRLETQAKLDQLKIDEPANLLKQKELTLRLQLIDAQTKQLGAGKELLRIRQSDLYTTQAITGALVGENAARDGASLKLADQSDAMAKLLMSYTMTADLSKRQIDLLNKEAEAAERAAEAYRKKWQIDKEGYSLNTAGDRVMAGETEQDVSDDVANLYGESNRDNEKARRARQLRALARLRSQGNGMVTQQGLDAAELRELQALEADLLNGGTTATRPNPTTATGGGTDTSGTSGTGTSSKPSAGNKPGGVSVVRMEVNLGGMPFSFGAADEASANTIAGMFTHLERSQKTTALR